MLRNINLRAGSCRIIPYITLLQLVDTMLQLTAIKYNTGMGISNYKMRSGEIVSFTTGVHAADDAGNLCFTIIL